MIRWWQFSKLAACPHSNLYGIYGDEIIAAGYKRLLCLDCNRFIDGPVMLAVLRRGELELMSNRGGGDS